LLALAKLRLNLFGYRFKLSFRIKKIILGIGNGLAAHRSGWCSWPASHLFFPLWPLFLPRKPSIQASFLPLKLLTKLRGCKKHPIQVIQNIPRGGEATPKRLDSFHVVLTGSDGDKSHIRKNSMVQTKDRCAQVVDGQFPKHHPVNDYLSAR
jgi:hypothetical protein